jgi:hypothetical protein
MVFVVLAGNSISVERKFFGYSSIEVKTLKLS